MKLHLLGGFLGSGKTTAIIHAAKALMDQGQVVGVITNDQGKYLVDTAFFRLSSIPAVEVTGGCFCCNYNDLDDRLGQMIADTRPDVIFAESVGSCADIVATVVRPLQEFAKNGVEPASFSVFTDGRLLRRRLTGEEMPFSEDVLYIFDKQIEEAGVIVVNKRDLLSPYALADILNLLNTHYPGKPFIAQDSRSLDGILPWLDQIQAGGIPLPEDALEIDYARYATGEAQLAWLDEELLVEFPAGKGQEIIQGFICNLVDELGERKAGIGHLKLAVIADSSVYKISIPSMIEPDWEKQVPWLEGEAARLIINARVEMKAEELRELIRKNIQASVKRYTVRGEDAFHPAAPKPTHRFS